MMGDFFFCFCKNFLSVKRKHLNTVRDRCTGNSDLAVIWTTSILFLPFYLSAITSHLFSHNSSHSVLIETKLDRETLIFWIRDLFGQKCFRYFWWRLPESRTFSEYWENLLSSQHHICNSKDPSQSLSVSLPFLGCWNQSQNFRKKELRMNFLIYHT